MDRWGVDAWVAGYERSWRTAGTDHLRDLFTEQASYAMSPYAEPAQGLAAIGELWERERVGPDEPFTMTHEIIAVENESAVVRVEVHYEATGSEFRDLWVLRFAPDGRCDAFEEWAFAPGS